jgi:glycosyltransferase involved in cell wall biosynthesis
MSTPKKSVKRNPHKTLPPSSTTNNDTPGKAGVLRNPSISVAIPTLNREEVLVDTIHDVLSQDFDNFELIVVDQSLNHKQATLDAIHNIKDPRFRYFRTTPPSLTVARNFAISKAKSPYIIFLDDDVRLTKNLIKTFLDTFTDNPDISAIAGRVMQDGFPITDNVLRFDQYGMTDGTYTGTVPAYTNAFPGGNNALKIVDALKAGGFDTRYTGSAFREENDLSLRMNRIGMTIYYQPKAELLHLAAPYGGTRVKTHLYDNPGFYANELFFTLRTVSASNLPISLRKKWQAYCYAAPGIQGYNRRRLFILGFIKALWRVAFGKQTVSTEIEA